MVFYSPTENVLRLKTIPSPISSCNQISNFAQVQVPPFTTSSLRLQLKVKCKAEMLPNQKESTTFSRSEIMRFSTASLTGISLLNAEPSEARIRRPDVRRKILEKLEREKAKAKQRADNRTTPRANEEDLSLPSFPFLQKDTDEALVEVSVSRTN